MSERSAAVFLRPERDQPRTVFGLCSQQLSLGSLNCRIMGTDSSHRQSIEGLACGQCIAGTFFVLAPAAVDLLLFQELLYQRWQIFRFAKALCGQHLKVQGLILVDECVA